MKLWLSKTSGAPLQQQLSAQFILGIVSADLAPGERLPSTSQLARRFKIHANTVRSAYRELVRLGWAEWKRGSGFYVRESSNKLDANVNLDHLISNFFETARNGGHSMTEVQSRIGKWLSLQPADHVVVIEPDPELRRVLTAEIEHAVGCRVVGVTMEEAVNPARYSGALCVALQNHSKHLAPQMPADARLLFMHSRSIPKRVAGESKPAPDDVITVISRWPSFLQWARTTLSAIGIDPETLDLRDARQKGWDRGLSKKSFIITDVVIAQLLPATCQPRVFHIVADESMEEIRDRMKAI